VTPPQARRFFVSWAALAAVLLPILVATPSAAVASRPAPAAFVPCPYTKITPNPPAPKPSPVPTHPADLPIAGGDGLNTDGLAVAADAPKVPTTSATSWLVADLDTGAVLGACAPHAMHAPASVQKLLLAATVMPKLDPKDVITITQEDMNFEPGSSAVGLIVGGKYTVETLWLGLFLNSGNDAANVLARLGANGRGVPGTVADMNTEARHLGALDTHADTPSGLDGPGQVTTAYDLALIARNDFARPDFARYDATKTAQMPKEPPTDPTGFQIQNDNRLLFEFPGAIGGKTGFTDIARHTYVGAAERNGRRLLVTMLNGEINPPNRLWQQGATLLSWGFSVPATASVGQLVAPGELDQVAPGANASAAASPSGSGAVPRAAALTSKSAEKPLEILGAVGVVVLAGLLPLFVTARRRRRRQY
jgi:D-alanyl-D-alanine carboxypeptidase (penicillin-binding protein 5/6)